MQSISTYSILAMAYKTETIAWSKKRIKRPKQNSKKDYEGMLRGPPKNRHAQFVCDEKRRGHM